MQIERNTTCGQANKAYNHQKGGRIHVSIVTAKVKRCVSLGVASVHFCPLLEQNHDHLHVGASMESEHGHLKLL